MDDNQNRPLLVLMLLLLIALLLGVYYFYFSKESYPLARTITSTEGKALDVLIIGRTGDLIHFDRLSDRERFEIPLGKLAWLDRIRALRYPEHEPPRKVVKKVKKEEPYIQNRLDLIEELKGKVDLYQTEIHSGTLTDTLQRKRTEQLAEVLKDIKELEVAIETYKWRTKKN